MNPTNVTLRNHLRRKSFCLPCAMTGSLNHIYVVIFSPLGRGLPTTMIFSPLVQWCVWALSKQKLRCGPVKVASMSVWCLLVKHLAMCPAQITNKVTSYLYCVVVLHIIAWLLVSVGSLETRLETKRIWDALVDTKWTLTWIDSGDQRINCVVILVANCISFSWCEIRNE